MEEQQEILAPVAAASFFGAIADRAKKDRAENGSGFSKEDLFLSFKNKYFCFRQSFLVPWNG